MRSLRIFKDHYALLISPPPLRAVFATVETQCYQLLEVVEKFFFSFWELEKKPDWEPGFKTKISAKILRGKLTK